MLSWSCRRFRARFEPGSSETVHPHRRACRECDAYAAALESAAAVRLPLPASLRKGLREIAAPSIESGTVLPFPAPRVPMPADLAARLRDLGPARRPSPPAWVLQPRFAVAASALLALVLGPFLVSAADRGRQDLGAVRVRVAPLVGRAGESGREELERLRLAASDTCDEARETAAASLHRLDTTLGGLTGRLSAALPEGFFHLSQGDSHDAR